VGASWRLEGKLLLNCASDEGCSKGALSRRCMDWLDSGCFRERSLVHENKEHKVEDPHTD